MRQSGKILHNRLLRSSGATGPMRRAWGQQPLHYYAAFAEAERAIWRWESSDFCGLVVDRDEAARHAREVFNAWAFFAEAPPWSVLPEEEREGWIKAVDELRFEYPSPGHAFYRCLVAAGDTGAWPTDWQILETFRAIEAAAEVVLALSRGGGCTNEAMAKSARMVYCAWNCESAANETQFVVEGWDHAVSAFLRGPNSWRS